MADRPTFPTLAEIARQYWIDREQWIATYRHPWLLWSISSPGGDALSASVTTTRGRSGRVALIGEPLLFPVVKRDCNPGAQGITIGRTDTNDIVVSDDEVSRFHAYLLDEEGRWKLVDAGSKNGTWVNGNQVPAQHQEWLEDGARVSIGGLEMQFFLAPGLVDYLDRTPGIGRS